MHGFEVCPNMSAYNILAPQHFMNLINVFKSPGMLESSCSVDELFAALHMPQTARVWGVINVSAYNILAPQHFNNLINVFKKSLAEVCLNQIHWVM